MANLSESYDKAVLIFSLVVALGLGAMVFLAKGKVEEDFADPASGGRASAPENPNEQLYRDTTENVGGDVVLAPPVNEDGREIENFVGTPLFLVQGREDPVDLGDSSYPEVHPPIPNQWWLDNRIDPGWSDSLRTVMPTAMDSPTWMSLPARPIPMIRRAFPPSLQS